jgi:hypothetical protein
MRTPPTLSHGRCFVAYFSTLPCSVVCSTGNNTSGGLRWRDIPDLQDSLLFCHSDVVFRRDWNRCIFITVCSHSFSTDFICSGFRVQFWSNCTRTHLSSFGVPYTVNSVNSVNILYFFPLGSVLCASLHGVSNLQTTTFFTVVSICNSALLIFVLSGLGISVSFLSSLETLAVSSPFGTLSLMVSSFRRWLQ